MTSISMHLFGKPEWEFGGKITADEIKAKGSELKARLGEIANAMEKLTAEGWEYDMTLYDLYFTKNISKKEAEGEIKRLNISKDTYQLMEDEEE